MTTSTENVEAISQSPEGGFPNRLPRSTLRRTAEPRLVRFKRIQAELGVQMCGGNRYGIFVESLDDDSPARGPDGLLPGDLILEVGGLESTIQDLCLPCVLSFCQLSNLLFIPLVQRRQHEEQN